jgi:hypothetical protein
MDQCSKKGNVRMVIISVALMGEGESNAKRIVA